MSAAADPFADFGLEARIADRAGRCGIDLSPAAADRLAAHARSVLRANPELHLTAITEAEDYLERHLGESFEGAAMIDPEARGLSVDLGSGNGYPAIPLAESRPGLETLLCEAAAKKAAFLREALVALELERCRVLEAQIQRPQDLDAEAPIRLVATRAMRSWPKVLPRLAPRLGADGQVLLWGGADVEAIARRSSWRRLKLVDRRALPGRERSWVWLFAPA